MEKQKSLKVWLPTKSDITSENLGFDSERETKDDKRRCSLTEYAKAQGLGVSAFDILGYREAYYTEDGIKACNWWLLNESFDCNDYYISPSGNVWSGMFVDDGGELYHNGYGIRPAIYIEF